MDDIGTSAATAGDEIDDTAVLMMFVIVDMAVEDDDARMQVLLPGLEHLGENLLCRPRGVATTVGFLVGGTGVRRVVENEKKKIDGGGERVEFSPEPVSLRAGGLVEGTVENQHEGIAHADRIETAVGKLGKPGEIVWQSDVRVTLEIVISEGGINGNAVITPGFRFRIVDGPIVGIFAGINDVATNRNEGRVLAIDGGDESLTNATVGRLRVGGIVEASVTKSDKTKIERDLKFQGHVIHGIGVSFLSVDSPSEGHGNYSQEKNKQKKDSLDGHISIRVSRLCEGRVNVISGRRVPLVSRLG